jgi:glycine/D-amino acid oxidase-like deaminating enzyme
MTGPHELDCVLIGGGIAALWTLDALDEAGFAAVLVEPWRLGGGQTLWSQGIIHGGVKYSLSGLLHPGASAVSEMPARWLESLAGRQRPDLSGVSVLSQETWLWRTGSIASRLGMLGARLALRTRPEEVDPASRPPLLRHAAEVHRLGEPCLDTRSLVASFRARHAERMIAAAGPDSISFRPAADRLELEVATVGGPALRLRARLAVLAAAGGNDRFRAALGLAPCSQRRPLHMGLVRGPADRLPPFFGHCVDGAATRVTITAARDADGRVAWQVGGKIAEDGVRLEGPEFLDRLRGELAETLPELDPAPLEFASYRADRIEARTAGGSRPDDASIVDDHPAAVTLFPTKLALAPRAAALAVAAAAARGIPPRGPVSIDAPRPEIGPSPWNEARFSAGVPR